MDQNFQTSFIPKKSMVVERATPTRSVGIFSVLSFFILITVLLATGGLYFFKGKIKNDIAEKEASLLLAKEGFEPSKITELQLLDRRLNASTDILSHHIAVTPIFQALQAITMKSVRFTKFSYSLGVEKDAKVNIKMSGQTVGFGAYSAYASLALQSDLFTTRDEGKNFINPIFSNLTLNDKGDVLFDLEFSVDPSFVDYKQMLLTQS